MKPGSYITHPIKNKFDFGSKDVRREITFTGRHFDEEAFDFDLLDLPDDGKWHFIRIIRHNEHIIHEVDGKVVFDSQSDKKKEKREKLDYIKLQKAYWRKI